MMSKCGLALYIFFAKTFAKLLRLGFLEVENGLFLIENCGLVLYVLYYRGIIMISITWIYPSNRENHFADIFKLNEPIDL